MYTPLVTVSAFPAVSAFPVVFWLSVGKVQLVSVPADGVPMSGVVSVIPANVSAAVLLLIATPVVPIYIVWSTSALPARL